MSQKYDKIAKTLQYLIHKRFPRKPLNWRPNCNNCYCFRRLTEWSRTKAEQNRETVPVGRLPIPLGMSANFRNIHRLYQLFQIVKIYEHQRWYQTCLLTVGLLRTLSENPLFCPRLFCVSEHHVAATLCRFVRWLRCRRRTCHGWCTCSLCRPTHQVDFCGMYRASKELWPISIN